RVNIPDAASLRLTTGMTLEAWVFPTSSSASWRDVIFKGDDNYYLASTTTTNSRPAIGVRNPNRTKAFGTANLALNTWTHLAATYDGTTLRLFVNGMLVSSVATSGPIITSTNQLQIGGDSIYGQYFQGRIDEVRVYNAALSAAQITADMNTAL